ncbi:MAG: addiction module protein [Chloroflexota bacterium]|nr:addiction module protein [Chloroflexota bacterium]
MSLSLKELEAEALHLPAEQRADLAQRLFASLEDEDTLEDAAEVEQAWIEEAERRYQRYLAGETQAVPAADALARVRTRLKNL